MRPRRAAPPATSDSHGRGSRATGAVRAGAMVAAVAAAILVLLLWHPQGDDSRPASPSPPPSPPPTPTAPPTSLPVPTRPAESRTVTRRSSVVVQWRPLPSPRPTFAPLRTPAPWPPPTPPTSTCLHVISTSASGLATAGQVLVEILARNDCGRTLAPLEIWFEVVGLHDGEPVSSARGHPFDPVRPGDETTVVVGLPGSPDWMPQISVRVLDTH